jgi:hypothetical protein
MFRLAPVLQQCDKDPLTQVFGHTQSGGRVRAPNENLM